MKEGWIALGIGWAIQLTGFAASAAKNHLVAAFLFAVAIGFFITAILRFRRHV